MATTRSAGAKRPSAGRSTKRSAAPAGVLETAGLKPGRGAFISTILIAALGIGLYVWSQTPWTGAIDAKQSEWKKIGRAHV